MDTPVVIECSQISYEGHRKWFVDLGRGEGGLAAAALEEPFVILLPPGTIADHREAY